MDELYARFLPQFVALARTRLATALAAVAAEDRPAATAVVRELHTLAGEAGLLGLARLVPLARDCEVKAKLWQAGHPEASLDALTQALRALAQMIEELAPAPT